MISCPLCNERIPTEDNENRMTGDCQCSREKMALRIIALRTALSVATKERDYYAGEVGF